VEEPSGDRHNSDFAILSVQYLGTVDGWRLLRQADEGMKQKNDIQAGCESRYSRRRHQYKR
jgi:hypothetical protein